MSISEAVMVTWSELIAIPAGLPIEALPFPVEPVTGALYRVRDEMFVIGAKSFSKSDAPGASRVNNVFWAAGDGAARRVLDMEIEADELSIATPPPEMLLRPDAITYGAIIKAGKERGLSFMESASYRIARDGKFVTRHLQSKSWRFFFRLRDGDSDRPFAIMRRLRSPEECTA